MKPRVAANPVSNLFASLSALVENGADPMATMDALLDRPKDKHGNVLIGIDDKHFNHWNAYLKDLVQFKVFGPIVIPTDPQLIKGILTKLKNAPGEMNGNSSSDLIAKLAGTDNIFSATDAATHASHKSAFKSHLHNEAANIQAAGPIVQQWLDGHVKNNKAITADNLEWLCSRLMTRFLLDEASANSSTIVDAVITLKKHFIQLATFEKLHKTGDVYENARSIVDAQIKELFSAEGASYPKKLAEQYSPDQAVSHIVSLFMVGFDNLRSVLQSTLVNLASHPAVRNQLAAEVMNVGGVPYLPVSAHDQHTSSNGHTGVGFFKESTRLMPPVWLQARKNGDNPVDITYKLKDGSLATYRLHPRTTVLIPLFHLARDLEKQHGNEFDVAREASVLPLPFSTGPNACPGRNIGYAAVGALLGYIIQNNLVNTVQSACHFEPKVSLTLGNATFGITKNGSVGEDQNLLPQRQYNRSGFWYQPAQQAVFAGSVASLAVYSATGSSVQAALAGTITTSVLLAALKHIEADEKMAQVVTRRLG